VPLYQGSVRVGAIAVEPGSKPWIRLAVIGLAVGAGDLASATSRPAGRVNGTVRVEAVLPGGQYKLLGSFHAKEGRGYWQGGYSEGEAGSAASAPVAVVLADSAGRVLASTSDA
jgi:hypothetical protein